MKRWTSLVFLLTVLLCPSEAVQPPNLVLIMADDLGYGELGCYGQRLIQTPHLDRMARDGMRFTQFYAGSTVCAPSRSVLMTGQHLGHTRVRGNAGKNSGAQMLREEDVTLAEMLRATGYATGLIGKWGLGMPGDEGHPNRQGFDYFYGYLSQHHAHNHFPDFLWKNETRVELPNKVKHLGEDGAGYATERILYSGDQFAEEAVSFIQKNKDQRFFLFLSLVAPHANNERIRDLADGNEVPDKGVYKDKNWSEPVKGHAAMISRLDAHVGQVLRRLDELKLSDKTLVMFTSDNGPHKEGGPDYKPGFFNASGPFSGIKRSLTDGGIRVPLIARWPGKIEPGSVSPHVSYFGDIMATFAELSGGALPSGNDGLSFVPALRGRNFRQSKHKFLYWEFYEGGFQQAVLMKGRYKVIRKGNSPKGIELYDLKHDLAERHNIAGLNPHLVERALVLMETERVDNEFWKKPVE